MRKVLVSKKQKMIVRVLSLFLLVFSILALGSCVSIIDSPILPIDYVPTDNSGYIYGQFDLLLPDEDLLMIHFGPADGNDLFGEDPTIGIIVENLANQKQLSFRLARKKENATQMFAVPPGNYRIVLVENLSYEGFPTTENFNMEGYKTDFVVEANTAVYIGDFSGSVGKDYNSMLTWSLKSTINNYDETTLTLFEKYPFLIESGINTVSNLLLSSYTTLHTPPIAQSNILPTDYVLTEGSSYIYGRFFKAYNKLFPTMAAARVIIIRNLDDSKKYSFVSEDTEQETLQILAVPPGNYRVESVSYRNHLGIADPPESFDQEEEGYKIDFTVAANTAVYLGDFIVSAETTFYYIGNMRVTTTDFETYPTENKFERTTADLQEKHPVLKESDITFVSHM